MNARLRRPACSPRALLLGNAPGVGLLTAGCGPTPNNGPAGPTKLKVGYLGLTCEAPIFVAQEKGFFKEEGLDVELVKTDWDGLQDGLNLGQFDANHTLVMFVLKPIEKGMDIKITGGIHTGCLRVQAGVNSPIKTVDDLRGKKIGVPTRIGSPPFLFASRVLAAHGVEPGLEQKQVEWTAFQPGERRSRLEKRRGSDAVADLPNLRIGTILHRRQRGEAGGGRPIRRRDEPYKDEYRCADRRQRPSGARKTRRPRPR